MNTRLLLPLLLTLLLAACGALPAAPAATPAGLPATDLGRGVNFGNALEAPEEGAWGLTLSEELFAAADEAGFDTIRLPVRWSGHALEAAPYTIDPAFFARVDWAVDQGLGRGQTVVLNMHHYAEIMSDPAGQRERYLALWRQIAERYRERPPQLVFELLNEPSEMSAAEWNGLMRAALETVRASNPTRTVVIGGVEWNSLSTLDQLDLPADDPNIIATFHYYEPFEFTHQGAEWNDDAQAWLGTTWEATPDQLADLRGDLDAVAAWSKRNNRPVWLGEFGAYRYGDMESRVRWTSAVAREAEARGVDWAYWEFAAGFGIYDPQTGAWNAPLRTALIP